MLFMLSESLSFSNSEPGDRWFFPSITRWTSACIAFNYS